MLADERRARCDRREQPRRRSDFSSIAHVARRIDAGETRFDMIADGFHGVRLVAIFACGCSASEPVGNGSSSVRVDTCAQHVAAAVTIDRRHSG